jgi:predicted transcriptional regulator
VSEELQFKDDLNQEKPKETSTKPQYRQIGTYTKSKEKYWKERQRRKQVLQLTDKGLTQKQIAQQLGISERTVKRDYAKILPYQKRQISKSWSKLEEKNQELIAELLEGKTFTEKLKMIKNLLKAQKWTNRCRKHARHQIKMIVDLDSLAKGEYLPDLEVSPKKPMSTTYPLKIVLQFKKDGRMFQGATVTLNNN